MRRTGCILLLAAIFVAGGCDYRDIRMVDSPSREKIFFKFDWSGLPGGELPTGVSVYCYPKDGKQPYVYKSNDTDLVEADMPSGTYDIIAFNQVESEYESFDFFGMDKFSTARVALREEEKPKWKLVADEQVCAAPELLAVDRLTDVSVTDEMYLDNSQHYILLKPRSVVYTVESTFMVYRTDEIRATYGEMSGLAGGMMLGSGLRTDPKSIQLFEDIEINNYSNSAECGEVTATFHTLGTPDVNGGENYVHYRFLLFDETTYCNFTFDVSDIIEKDDSLLRIQVDMGFDKIIPQEPGYDVDPERPGILPSVTPKGSSGMDAVVSGWGNDVVINL